MRSYAIRQAWLLLTCAFLLAAPLGFAFVQDEKEKKKDAPTKDDWKKQLTVSYYGATNCGNCHTRGKVAKPSDNLCRLDEYDTWSEKDKHKDAFKGLESDRALKMAKVLNLKVEKLPNPVVSDQQCVSCHGVVIRNKKEEGDTFSLQEGVSCVACHGHYEEWVTKHVNIVAKGFISKEWRALDRDTKEKKYGLLNLWDPSRRAQVCASCHVGNYQEGKVVTHAMYAAGHPPLPGLETATFSDAMPRHWDYHQEKNPAILEVLAKTDPTIKVGDLKLEKTELVLLAGLVSFRETIRLLADQAVDLKGNANAAWPDFANYDCYACHHDLKSKSWRQQRGYAGKPGRPTLRYWPTTLVKLAMFHLAEDGKANEMMDELRNQMAPLQKVLDQDPFGEPKAVAGAAGPLIGWLDQQIAQAQAKPFDQKAARRLLDKLGAMGTSAKEGDILDYDSARQVAWAYRTIHQELNFDREKKKYPEDLPSWKSLRDLLRLDFPAGQKFTAKANQADIDKVIETGVDDALRSLNQYDPATLRKALFDAIPKAK